MDSRYFLLFWSYIFRIVVELKRNVVKHFNSKGLVTSFIKKIILCIYLLSFGHAGSSLLRGLLCSCGVWASRCSGQKSRGSGRVDFSSCGTRAPEHRLKGHMGLSCSLACGVFPDQGWYSCLLYWRQILYLWATRDATSLLPFDIPLSYQRLFLFHTRGSFSDDVVFLQLKESFFYCFLDSVPCLFSFWIYLR